VGPRLLGI